MKIAVIAPTYLPGRRANTIQVMKMSDAIVTLGHQIQVAVPFNPKEHPEYADSKLTSEESNRKIAAFYGLKNVLPVHYLRAQPQWRRYDYGIRAVSWAKQGKADMIYTRLPQAAAMASIWGIPTVLEIHDLPQGKFGRQLFTRFLRGKGAKHLVVITSALAKALQEQFKAPLNEPFTIIAPDGVDLEQYQNMPSPREAREQLASKENTEAVSTSIARLSQDAFVAGYTGHLYEGRGINIIMKLASRLPDIQFLIAGGEPQTVEKWREKVQKNNLSNVILTGFIPNPELYLYQAACDVLLMPYQQHVSASSGGDIARFLSPMKLFEYLACKRPILSSNLPVLREVLNPQNAVLLPPKDIRAWENALIKLKNNPEMRQKLAAQARKDDQKYAWINRAEKIFGLPKQ